MWSYKSPIGTFFIKPIPQGGYGTILNDTVYEVCNNPNASADNIYMHCIGCHEWDSLDGSVDNVPHDLSEWSKC